MRGEEDIHTCALLHSRCEDELIGDRNGQAALGLGGQDGSLVIDLSKFNGVNYGQDGDGTVVVGGGAYSTSSGVERETDEVGGVCRSSTRRSGSRSERPGTGNSPWNLSLRWDRRPRGARRVRIHEQDVGNDSR